MSSNKRAVVTGANGFTGRYLCQLLLDQGYQVDAFVHGGALGIEGVSETQVPLSDAGRLAEHLQRLDPTHIFHLAAISFVAHDKPAAIYEVNTIGADNIPAGGRGLLRAPGKNRRCEQRQCLWQSFKRPCFGTERYSACESLWLQQSQP